MKNSESTFLIALGVLWIIVQWFTYQSFGINSSVDVELYLSDAKTILLGSVPCGRSIMYLSYSVLLAVVHWFGLSSKYIIVFTFVHH